MPTQEMVRPRSLVDDVSRQAYRAAETAYVKAAAVYQSEAKRWCEARKDLLKQADFGENQNPEFENAFGSVAFTYLREKAPGLVPHVLGFQLLDRSDGGKRAVGAFVAKVGDKIIDIPMFFINGELKGHHIMRLRNPDLFIPLREAFLEYLFSKIPQGLGDPGPGLQEQSSVRSTPDIQPFSGSRYLKAGEDLHWVRDWAKDQEVKLAEAYADMRLRRENLELGIALREKKAGTHVDLLETLSKSPNLLKTAAAMCDAYPKFHGMLDRLMGDGWLVKAANAQYRVRPDVPRIGLPRLRGQKRISKLNSKQAELEILDGDKLAASWGDSQKRFVPKGIASKYSQEVQTWGDVIVDRRPADKLSQAYEVEKRDAVFDAVDEPGVYSVLDVDGKQKDMVVIPAPSRPESVEQDLILNLSAKKFTNANRNHYVTVRSNDFGEPSPLQKIYDGNIRRPSPGDLFLVAENRNSVYGPFYCKEKIGPDHLVIEDLSDSCRDDLQGVFPESDLPGMSFDSYSPLDEIVFIGGAASREAVVGSGGSRVMTLPKQTKVFRFGKYVPDDDYSGGPSEFYPNRRFRDACQQRLFDQQHIRLEDLSKYANLRVRKAGVGRFEVNDQSLTKSAARRQLVQRYRLGKADAERILGSEKLSQIFFVVPPGRKLSSIGDVKKLAYFSPDVEFPEEDQPYGSETGRYEITTPEERYSVSEQQPEREPLGPFDELPPKGNPSFSEDMQAINEGDASDVMADMVGLVSLLRNSRIDSSIKALTKSLLQTVDKLGRQLFIFYAHPDEFAEAYGDDELEDIESAMVTVLEAAGDLFITFNRRSADPNPELDISDLPAAV